MARIRSATKAELKACREDPRQFDLIEFLHSLPDQALLDEVERRYPLGHQFAQDLHEACPIELDPDEVFEVVKKTLLHDDILGMGMFEDDLRKLLKSCEDDEDTT